MCLNLRSATRLGLSGPITSDGWNLPWTQTSKRSETIYDFRINYLQKYKSESKIRGEVSMWTWMWKSSVPINIDTKAKAKKQFGGINFTSIFNFRVYGIQFQKSMIRRKARCCGLAHRGLNVLRTWGKSGRKCDSCWRWVGFKEVPKSLLALGSGN